MKTIFQKTDFVSRRSFITQMASSMLGLTAVPILAGTAQAANTITSAANQKLGGKAKAVIYLYMSGGMSHLDTFDTKPGAETQGPVESIDTSADGVQISQFFPNLAKQMNHVAVINSMYSNQGAHAQGRYFMHTGYVMRGTITHPDLGAWSAYHLGKSTVPCQATSRSVATVLASVAASLSQVTQRFQSAIQNLAYNTVR